MNYTYRRTSDRGVSESIGFLLIFGMVIVGIGLVTLYGYPMLLQQQTSADKQIMQKNMIVLQNDMKSLAYKTVPYKETMLNVGGGELTVYPSTYPESLLSSMRIYDAGGSGISYENQFHSGDLRYHSLSAGSDISLQNGAVVMRNLVEPGSTMLAQPRWFYDATTRTMVINLVSLNSSFPISRSGVGTVQMRMNMTNYSVTTVPAGVCVAYTPNPAQNYQVAWDDYFTGTLKLTTGGGCNPGDYRLPLNSGDTLVIKKYDVEIYSV
jgi:hypothetical protein